MKSDKAKVVAAAAAVSAYLSQQERARREEAERARSLSPWAIFGRQEIMNQRMLWQRRMGR